MNETVFLAFSRNRPSRRGRAQLRLVLALAGIALSGFTVARTDDEVDGKTYMYIPADQLQRIAANPGLLDDRYVRVRKKEIKASVSSMTAEVYRLRDMKPGEGHEDIPECLVLVRAQGKKALMPILLPADWPFPEALEDVFLLRGCAEGLVLTLEHGGNAHFLPYGLVVSLNHKNFLSSLGLLTAEEIGDGDEGDVFRVNSVWEEGVSGLITFCHADDPGADTLFTVREGHLVPDKKRNTQRWREELIECDKRIASYLEKAKQGNQRAQLSALVTALHRFLVLREMGKEKGAWKAFRRDLRRWCPDLKRVPLGGGGTRPIEEVEAVMKKSLKEWGHYGDLYPRPPETVFLP